MSDYGARLNDIVVPARHGGAVEVQRGQVLRIYLLEGQQVGDCAFINAHDHREHFHVGQTWALNVMLGHGSAHAYKYFYSNPPFENVMFTVLSDTVGRHFGQCGGRCSRRLLAMRDGAGEEARSCQENLAQALVPYGIEGHEIGDCFNVFMNVELDADGGFSVQVPQTRAGDHLDLRAEMDIIVALSACPNDSGPVNNYRAKPLGMSVFAPAGSDQKKLP